MKSYTIYTMYVSNTVGLCLHVNLSVYHTSTSNADFLEIQLLLNCVKPHYFWMFAGDSCAIILDPDPDHLATDHPRHCVPSSDTTSRPGTASLPPVTSQQYHTTCCSK